MLLDDFCAIDRDRVTCPQFLEQDKYEYAYPNSGITYLRTIVKVNLNKGTLLWRLLRDSVFIISSCVFLLPLHGRLLSNHE